MSKEGDDQESDDNSRGDEQKRMDEIGGKTDKKKGKKKVGVEKDILEEDKPRNRKYMEDEGNSRKKIKVPVEEFYLNMNWDWRLFRGIISNVIHQRRSVICWAISFIRAIEALFNIGKRIEDQQSFSIQHLVNNIRLGLFGLRDTNTLREFVMENGVYEEGECSYARVKKTCDHPQNPNTTKIDDVAIIDSVDDVELARLVHMHPVVGVLPLEPGLSSYRNGIYQPSSSPSSLETPVLHAVLIIGFGVDKGKFYWLIQNSWGRTWGVDGYGRLHREHVAGRRSVFKQVYYGKKSGYPENQKK